MGCHTWFLRPITKAEFNTMKEYAPVSIMSTCGPTEENIQSGVYNHVLYQELMNSWKYNSPCVYGNTYWWQLGYGADKPGLFEISTNNTEPSFESVRQLSRSSGLYVTVSTYWDLFRLLNYPDKVIRSRHDLRRYLRKRYFELSADQLEKISEFFRRYPGGAIVFG